MSEKLDRDALKAFAKEIVPGGLILSAGRAQAAELRFFLDDGFRMEAFLVNEAQPPELSETEVKCWQIPSLALLQLTPLSYDAIWCHGLLDGHPPAAWQRTMTTFFKCAKPGTPIFFSFEEKGEITSDEVASLLRQNGFQPHMRGAEKDRTERIAYIARRI